MKTCTALVAALIMFGLLLPEAHAAHPTRICLDVEQERVTAVSDDDIVDAVRALVGATDDGHPPQQEGCVTENGGAGGGGQVDFEITGASDPDDSDTPETPDMSCDIPADQSSCWAYPPNEEEGDQTIAGWIDFDRDDSTVELDRSEGWDEETEPGAGEPDETDVVLWTWSDGNYAGYPTFTTIRYSHDRKAFRGSVKNGYAPCRERQIVVKKRRDGADKVVGRTDSGSRGSWTLKTGPVRGRFYAIVEEKMFNDLAGNTADCYRGRSFTIRVP